MMKNLLIAILAIASLAAGSAQAEDKMVMLPVAGAMAANDAQSRLGDNVKFYFGDQPTPTVIQRIATDTVSLRTNAFGKSDAKACNWVFLSDMIELKKRAVEMGANAVINITNNWENAPRPNATEFECHVGAIMAGVAFKAEFVKIADK
jgi:uncharacterized protein YbjQ (UPF0145 family)